MQKALYTILSMATQDKNWVYTHPQSGMLLQQQTQRQANPMKLTWLVMAILGRCCLPKRRTQSSKMPQQHSWHQAIWMRAACWPC